MLPAASDGYLYHVFISYSHASQHTLSQAVEQGLKRLLRGPFQRSALNVFRDESALSAGHDGIEQILRHLSKSHWFLLIASPAAAQSPWCKRELRWWLGDEHGAYKLTDEQLDIPIALPLNDRGQHRLKRLIIARAEGNLVRTNDGSDWRWEPEGNSVELCRITDALPGFIRGVYHKPPLYADLQAHMARTLDELTIENQHFADDLARIAVPIHTGETGDDEIALQAEVRGLLSEDRRKQQKNLRIAQSAAGLIAILLLLTLYGAFLIWSAGKNAAADRDAYESLQIMDTRPAASATRVISAQARPNRLAPRQALFTLNTHRTGLLDWIRFDNSTGSPNRAYWTLASDGGYWLSVLETGTNTPILFKLDEQGRVRHSNKFTWPGMPFEAGPERMAIHYTYPLLDQHTNVTSVQRNTGARRDLLIQRNTRRYIDQNSYSKAIFNNSLSYLWWQREGDQPLQSIRLSAGLGLSPAAMTAADEFVFWGNDEQLYSLRTNHDAIQQIKTPAPPSDWQVVHSGPFGRPVPIQLSANGQTIIQLLTDGTDQCAARALDSASGSIVSSQPIVLLPYCPSENILSVSNDGQTIIGLDADRPFMVHNGKQVTQRHQSGDSIKKTALAGSGKKEVRFETRSKTLQQYSIDKDGFRLPAAVTRFTANPSNHIPILSFSPDDKLIAVSDPDGYLAIFHSELISPLSTELLRHHHIALPQAADYRSGRLLTIGDANQLVQTDEDGTKAIHRQISNQQWIKLRPTQQTNSSVRSTNALALAQFDREDITKGGTIVSMKNGIAAHHPLPGQILEVKLSASGFALLLRETDDEHWIELWDHEGIVSELIRSPIDKPIGFDFVGPNDGWLAVQHETPTPELRLYPLRSPHTESHNNDPSYHEFELMDVTPNTNEYIGLSPDGKTGFLIDQDYRIFRFELPETPNSIPVKLVLSRENIGEISPSCLQLFPSEGIFVACDPDLWQLKIYSLDNFQLLSPPIELQGRLLSIDRESDSTFSVLLARSHNNLDNRDLILQRWDVSHQNLLEFATTLAERPENAP